jgi:hypothetical protein
MKDVKDKAQCQRIHAKKRAFERYGIVLNRPVLNGIIQDIQNNRATFIEKQSNAKSFWFVMVGEQKCRVVYDKNRKTISTFLPLETKEEKELNERED